MWKSPAPWKWGKLWTLNLSISIFQSWIIYQKFKSFPHSTNMFTFCRRNAVYLNISGRRVEYAWNWKIWTVAKLGIDGLKTFIAGHRYSEIVEMDTVDMNTCIGGHRCSERLYRKVRTSIFKTCTDEHRYSVNLSWWAQVFWKLGQGGTDFLKTWTGGHRFSENLDIKRYPKPA